ncbi:MAG: DUF928 domain-containing protein, partial [Symploca sp. SIO2G7]|nr:DUF928 domain-containing protein [Symploca sp. SIO2G7]
MPHTRFHFGQLALAFSLPLALSTGCLTLFGKHQVLLAQGIPELWEFQEYQPPSDIGRPRRIKDATTRSLSSSCDHDGKPLTALLPPNQLGLTAAAYPTLFVYIPAFGTEALPMPVEFVLEDQNGREIYQATFPTSGISGIVALGLPAKAGLSPLKVDQDYYWRFTVICNKDERSQDVVVGGVVRRVELESDLKEQLMVVSPEEQVQLYAEAGIWHNALSTLVQLRRNRPTDLKLAADWEKLLKAVELGDIAQEPIESVPATTLREFNLPQHQLPSEEERGSRQQATDNT